MATSRKRRNRPAALEYRQRLESPPDKMVWSPWSYPGGKKNLRKRIIGHLPRNRVLVEPFVGGGWVFLGADFPYTIINDKDPAVADFWKRLFLTTDEEFDQLAADMTILAELAAIPSNLAMLEKDSNTDGMAALLLNRFRFSGIIGHSALRIGKGLQQLIETLNPTTFQELNDYNTVYNIGRFLRRGDGVVDRMKAARVIFKRRVEVHSGDFEDLAIPPDATIFADPPYVDAGPVLYRTGTFDHERLAKWLKRQKVPWILTYDSHPLIWKLYRGHRIEKFDATYSVNPATRDKRKKEVMVFSR